MGGGFAAGRGRVGIGRVGRGAKVRFELFGEGAEFETFEPTAEGGPVDGAGGEVVEGEGQREIAFDGGEFACFGEPFARGTEVFTHLAADFVRMGDEFVERRVLVEPFRSGFGATACDAGDVVDAVTDKREVVGDLCWRDTEFGDDACLVERFVAHGVDPEDTGSNELGKVFVAGGDHDFPPAGTRLRGEGGDDVVGFDTWLDDQWPTHEGDELVERFDLGCERFRHRRAVGFVFGKEFVAERGPGGVENARAVFGREAGFEPGEHGDDAADRARGFALGGAQVGQRVEGTVEEAAAVDEYEPGHESSRVTLFLLAVRVA